MNTTTTTPFRVLLKQITPDYWLMLTLIFLMKAGQFLLIPFLTLYITVVTHATPTAVGIAVGAGPIAYGLAGPYAGYLVDRFGARTILNFSLLAAAILFIGFNLSHTILFYACLNVAVNISRALFDTATKSYRISEMTAELRRLAISLRFTLVNSAAAIGMAIGANFILHGATHLFVLTGVLYLFLTIANWIITKNADSYFSTANPIKMKTVFQVLLTDKLLIAITLASLFFWTCYAQLDTTWPMNLYHQLGAEGVHIFTICIMINAIGCAVLLLPLSRLIRQLQEPTQAVVGSLLLFIAFLILMWFLNLNWLVIASVFIVLGECFLTPLFDALTFKIAPSHLVGSYYGALGFASLGLGVGPIVGGYLYQYGNSKHLFFCCLILLATMGCLLGFAAHVAKIKNTLRR